MLVPTLHKSGTLSERQLREPWQLRCDLLALKPEVDPEEDYATFCAWTSNADVGVIWGRDGQGLAMFSFQAFDGERDGEPYRLSLFECRFSRPEIRGHISVSLLYARLRGRLVRVEREAVVPPV